MRLRLICYKLLLLLLCAGKLFFKICALVPTMYNLFQFIYPTHSNFSIELGFLKNLSFFARWVESLGTLYHIPLFGDKKQVYIFIYIIKKSHFGILKRFPKVKFNVKMQEPRCLITKEV